MDSHFLVAKCHCLLHTDSTIINSQNQGINSDYIVPQSRTTNTSDIIILEPINNATDDETIL